MREVQHTLLQETANSFVYLAEVDGYDRPVVLKVLKAGYPSPQRIIQFNNEYEFTKDLELKGVRRAFRSEKKDGRYTLMLEYIEGETVREAFVKSRRPLESILSAAVGIVGALMEIHGEGIVHKDLNPNNIIINQVSGQVTIIDFGISSRIDFKTRHPGNPDRLEGSLAYLSPEQTGRMNRVVDYRTDFYSLGITLYEMLTGRLPFEATDSVELVHSHIARVPPAVHELDNQIPKVVSDIVARLMSKNAEDRYQSAYGLREDLQRCQLMWQHTGKIEPFDLGESDFSGEFKIPQKLYGREAETTTLMAAFERAANGSLEMVLVSGNAAGMTTYHFTQALVSLALCANADAEEQEAHLEGVKANLAQFETWSKNCPENFRHKYLLLKAELARVEGADLDAMRLYNDAIRSAQQQRLRQRGSVGQRTGRPFHAGAGHRNLRPAPPARSPSQLPAVGCCAQSATAGGGIPRTFFSKKGKHAKPEHDDDQHGYFEPVHHIECVQGIGFSQHRQGLANPFG